MGYLGGSSLVKGSWMGNSEEEWTFSAKSLFGGDGFSDSAEFRRYCDTIDRMKAFAHSWFAASEEVRPRIEGLVVSAMVDASAIERGKSPKLMKLIREVRGWPVAFVEALSQGREPEPDLDSAPAMRM